MHVAAALEYGWTRAQLIHRDIKPDNIFITTSSLVKILDFGLARIENQLLPSNPEDKTASFMVETQPGALLGTVSYMSPEQIRGQPADARSDIFAFGCVLYQMVTNKRPFDRDTNADTMAAILYEPSPQLSESGRARPVELDRYLGSL